MKAARNAWIKRAKRLRDKSEKLRLLTWDTLEVYYEKQPPGSSKKTLRTLIVSHLKVIAHSIASDILSDNVHAQAAYRMVCTTWQTIEMQADNPFEIPAYKAWSVAGHEAQHLTRITKHCVVSFICRDCGYYGPCWAQAVTGKWWFRCFNCGTHYLPWAEGEGKSAYNRIIAIQDPITQVVKHIPAIWPATAEDNWLSGMAEVFARKIETPADLQAFAEKTAIDINKLVQNAGNPSYYKQFAFKEEAQWRFTAPRWPLEHFQDIVENGFVGEIWRPDNYKTTEVFSQWEELAELLGKMIAIGERLSKL